jgi:hypothetical protein
MVNRLYRELDSDSAAQVELRFQEQVAARVDLALTPATDALTRIAQLLEAQNSGVRPVHQSIRYVSLADGVPGQQFAEDLYGWGWYLDSFTAWYQGDGTVPILTITGLYAPGLAMQINMVVGTTIFLQSRVAMPEKIQWSASFTQTGGTKGNIIMIPFWRRG